MKSMKLTAFQMTTSNRTSYELLKIQQNFTVKPDLLSRKNLCIATLKSRKDNLKNPASTNRLNAEKSE